MFHVKQLAMKKTTTINYHLETIVTCYQDLAAILTIMRQYLRNVDLCELRYKC